MPQRTGVAAALAIVVLAGCSGGSNPSVTATTAAPATTVPPPPTSTTTSLAEGPKALSTGSLIKAGEYVTIDFEPTTVLYRFERDHLLKGFQNLRVTGVENQFNSSAHDSGVRPYRGVAVHGLWHRLTPEEIIEELEEIETLQLGPSTGTAVGGFPGLRIEATAMLRDWLWIRVQGSGGDIYRQWLFGQGPIHFIIVETPPGTLLITIQATAEEWDEFLPVAEEILDGISFPDLESSR